MEFVRLKYANNKLINADIKEHREVIEEYVNKKAWSILVLSRHCLVRAARRSKSI